MIWILPVIIAGGLVVIILVVFFIFLYTRRADNHKTYARNTLELCKKTPLPFSNFLAATDLESSRKSNPFVITPPEDEERTTVVVSKNYLL